MNHSHRKHEAPGSEIGYEGISEVLRREILAGRWKTGARLPTRRELQARFRTTSATIQNALDVLIEEGFVQSAGRRGTFVMDDLPHLRDCALIFPHDPTELEARGWSHLYSALTNEAAKIQQVEKRRIECFYGINAPVDSVDYHRLVARIEAHQLAGLIFTANPGRLLDTPLLKAEGIARVGVMSNMDGRNIPGVMLAGDIWFEKALDYLAGRGRRRVAFVSIPGTQSMIESNGTLPLLAERGLSTRRYWDLALPLWASGAPHIVQLLMQSAGERPDALVVTDDNLVEPVVSGLLAAGVRVPEDLEVVAHANFPHRGPRVLPLKWLGYDSHAALRMALAIIDQQCRGEKPPAVTELAPVFEEELATRRTTTERSLTEIGQTP